MSTELIITICSMGITLLGTIFGLIKSIVNGNLKKFVEEKMAEAEATGKTGAEKYNYVINAVKEKYKLGGFISLAKKFIEELIDFSKKVNSK